MKQRGLFRHVPAAPSSWYLSNKMVQLDLKCFLTQDEDCVLVTSTLTVLNNLKRSGFLVLHIIPSSSKELMDMGPTRRRNMIRTVVLMSCGKGFERNYLRTDRKWFTIDLTVHFPAVKGDIRLILRNCASLKFFPNIGPFSVIVYL